MAKNNEYLESFKIEMVRKYMTSESKKDICQKYGISKSTFWGWKCKYGDLISKELATDAKPERRGNFVDIVAPAKDEVNKPKIRYEGTAVVSMEVKGYTLHFSVEFLPKVLELLGL